MAAASPKLRLYTNHGCPWAHRAHIALSELKVPFDEEIIDLQVPRTAEYLQVNPRGLVPSLRVDDQIITESAVVAAFLADAFPSHLVPASTDANGPLTRARIAFFVDTYMSKVNGSLYPLMKATTEEERSAIIQKTVDAVVKEIEPLLANAGPFFGGSSQLTLAEVLTGSFVIRLWSWPKYGLVPQSVIDQLSEKAPNFSRWAEAVSKHPSVNGIFDAEGTATGTKARLAKA
ncbi:glutathione S-transferase domain-containing protein [Xylaria bambusicola]|uniref:glutathione S-transferase domain-containing protein n=1 Tax=Xylaria bambusicola TaxID=326684 RepID=UPI002008C651|nr:glutathione S-transferase domain-containing protein [Xylaria bambusicola]KAI0508918.1 glutathione S-transferase domain-containing protein [Xylaria bambusicola]